MSDVATISQSLQEARSSVTEALRMVESATDAEEVDVARRHVAVAREWAKVQKVAEQMHEDLLALEIACLRRIYELDALDILPGTHNQSAAKYFAKLNEEEIRAVIARNAHASTANGVKLAEQKSAAHAVDFERGRSISDGAMARLRARIERQEQKDAERAAAEADLRPPPTREERELIQVFSVEDDADQYISDVRGAVAHLVDEYAGRSFTIAEMADAVLDDLEIPYDNGVMEGIREVCRAAVRRAPLKVSGMSAPAFVTCPGYHDTDRFIRIPFRNASVRQLNQMVELRERQLAEDTAALDRLKAMRDELAGRADSDVSLLGDLLTVGCDKAA